jgi:lysozyme
MTLGAQLMRDEGFQGRPYKDSVGKTTIGYGRNLDDNPLTRIEAAFLLDNDINTATDKLLEALPWVGALDEVRKAVLINMTFNMGIGGLMGFHHFLAAVQAGDYSLAKDHMLASKWADQVGPRAHRLAIQIETGTWQ